MVYVCDHCHFLFSRVSSTTACPDCGKENIRPAEPEEIREFESRKKVDLWNEDRPAIIRAGKVMQYVREIQLGPR